MDIKIKLNQPENKIAATTTRNLEMPPPLLQATLTKESQAVCKNQAEAEKIAKEKKARIAAIYKELNELVGLKDIKKNIYEVQAYVEIQRRRSLENLHSEPTVLHAVFSGNPGTGKTTLARVLARLYKEIGIISQGQLIEVERADLVGEYIGHTAAKTKEQVKKALGGVLFIDEAYSLARGGSKDFGREAIDVLVKAMEDHKNDFVVILAGYRDEMISFINTNPGLNSRFPLQIDFPDYSIDELIDIADMMYQAREYCLETVAKQNLRHLLGEIIEKQPKHHGNARLVRNIVEASLRQQAVRLVEQTSVTKEELQIIKISDLPQSQVVFSRPQNQLTKQINQHLNNCVPLFATS